MPNERHMSPDPINADTIRPALQFGGLVFSRLLPLVVFSPLFGGQTTPRRFRTALTIVLAVILTISMGFQHEQQIDGVIYTGLVAKELFVGLTLAMFIVVLFEAFAAVGGFIDVTRGATIANVLDPMTRQQNPIVGLFYKQLALTLFLTLGGFRLVIATLADSFLIVPLDRFAPAAIESPESAKAIVNLVGEMFLVALRLAMPVVAVIFLLDVALGLLNRVAPQVQVFFLGMTIKAWLGLLIALLTIGVVIDQGFDYFGAVFGSFDQWMHLVRPER